MDHFEDFLGMDDSNGTVLKICWVQTIQMVIIKFGSMVMMGRSRGDDRSEP